jgi:hypothetical protein
MSPLKLNFILTRLCSSYISTLPRYGASKKVVAEHGLVQSVLEW